MEFPLKLKTEERVSEDQRDRLRERKIERERRREKVRKRMGEI